MLNGFTSWWLFYNRVTMLVRISLPRILSHCKYKRLRINLWAQKLTRNKIFLIMGMLQSTLISSPYILWLRSRSFIFCTNHFHVQPCSLYNSPTDTPSMQNLILEGLQQKLQKSCSRCNKNTWHIESSYILQPPKYLLLFVNRFRYLNNNITKDRCPIPLDTTVRLGPLKFNLQATIDHQGPSIDSGHYTASINCCKKHSIATITELRSLELPIKNSSTAYIVLYKWIDTWFLDSNRRVGVWSLPWRWHILSIPLTTGRGTSAETCGLDDVFPPDDLGSRPEALCIYIYMYIYICVLSLYELCYRSYIQRDCHSVLAKLHPITFYRGVRGSWSECHFVFSLVYQLCLALW